MVGVLNYRVVYTKLQACVILVIVRSYLQSECAYYNEGHNELSCVCIFWIFCRCDSYSKQYRHPLSPIDMLLVWTFSTWFMFKRNGIIVSVKQWQNNLRHRNFDNILDWSFTFTFALVRTDPFCTIGYQFITRKSFLGVFVSWI